MEEHEEENIDIENSQSIEFYLDAFMPYISECVPAKELLTVLRPYFSEAEILKISTLSDRDPVDATRLAFQKLKEKKSPGIYRAIREALGQAGFTKVFQILSGKWVSFEDEENCKKVIQLFTCELVDRITPTDLIPYLYQQGVLLKNDMEEIRCEERNRGQSAAAFILVSRIPQRTPDWFKHFLIALISVQQLDLAEKLDPDLFNKIMVQTEECQRISTKNGEEIPKLCYASTVKSENLKVDTDEKQTGPGNKWDVKVDRNYESSECSDEDFDTYENDFDSEGTLDIRDTDETDLKCVVVEQMTELKLLDDCQSPLNDTTGTVTRPKKQDSTEPESINFQDAETITKVSDKQVELLAGNNSVHITNQDYSTTAVKKPDRRNEENIVRPKVKISSAPSAVYKPPHMRNDGMRRNYPEPPKRDFNAAINAPSSVYKPPHMRNGGMRRNYPDPPQRDFNAAINSRELQTNCTAFSDQSNDGRTVAGAEVDRFNGVNDLSEARPTIYITTDQDNIPFREDDESAEIPLRQYQKELAEEGCTGENCIIIAPTNSGKTWVACEIIRINRVTD